MLITDLSTPLSSRDTLFTSLFFTIYPFQQDNLNPAKFDGLDTKIIPVFLLERYVTVKGHFVRQRQVPMCPAFSLTDYKVQGSTLATAVLYLKHNPSSKGENPYKKYRSNYV